MAGNTFSNQAIAKLLREISAVLQVTGANTFRVRAYDNAADALEHESVSLHTLWQQGKLASISGIGSSISQHLDELFTTGKSAHFDKLKKQGPPGMFPLLDIPGIGPKTAYKLAKELKLNSHKDALSQLKKAATAGKIATIEGLGEKTQQDILKSIKRGASKTSTRMRLDVATTISQDLLAYIKKCEQVEDISALGSLRRRRPTIGDVDLGLTTTKPDIVVAHITAYPKIKSLLAKGNELVRFIHISGENVDIKIVPPQQWGSLLQHFTGSKAHNVSLRELALKKGYSLSEQGIKVKRTKKPFPSEKAFYNFLGLDWIPPEIREDTGEIQAAAQHHLPNLVDTKDIKGDFHTHTNYDWSSSHDYGQSSPQELIAKAQTLGYAYLALGDHNPSLKNYSEKEALREIQKRTTYLRNIKPSAGEKVVKKRIPRVLVTLEVDIRPDGTLALPKDAHHHLDFIIASIHSNLTADKHTQTNRVLKAIESPGVKIIGHPTGRILGSRPGFELDWDRIFKACLKHHVALEINANPARLDLDDLIARQAALAGVKLAVSTDSHHALHLDYLSYGVDVARRAWLTKQNLVNTLDFASLEKWLAK